MSSGLTDEVVQDTVAVSLARAVAVANRRARELGIDIGNSLITITQDGHAESSLWRINYGPSEYIGRRGGDLLIEVAAESSSIRRILRGQ